MRGGADRTRTTASAVNTAAATPCSRVNAPTFTQNNGSDGIACGWMSIQPSADGGETAATPRDAAAARPEHRQPDRHRVHPDQHVPQGVADHPHPQAERPEAHGRHRGDGVPGQEHPDVHAAEQARQRQHRQPGQEHPADERQPGGELAQHDLAVGQQRRPQEVERAVFLLLGDRPADHRRGDEDDGQELRDQERGEERLANRADWSSRAPPVSPASS